MIFPGAAGFDGENYEHLVFTDGRIQYPKH